MFKNTGNSWGRGVFDDPLEWKFLGVGGAIQNTLPFTIYLFSPNLYRGVWIFSGTTHSISYCLCILLSISYNWYVIGVYVYLRMILYYKLVIIID